MNFVNLNRWPTLSSYVLNNHIEAIDLVLAQMILKNHPNSSEEVGAFFIKLVLASRTGHLCLKKTSKALLPSCRELIDDEDVAVKLDDLALIGMKEVPKEIIGDSLDPGVNYYPVVLFSDFFYLNKNLFFETRFLQQIQKIKNLPKQDFLYAVQPSAMLNDEQKRAVALSLKNNVILITGGPGTGKTFTATEIVKEYLRYNEQSGRGEVRILLTAPTGKAAVHLEKNVRKNISAQESLVAGTLHSILSAGYNEEMINNPPIIHADMIIVDEASMIDARLFSYFLSALQPHTKLILMGDKDQLPPVDSGSFFADLVEYSLENVFIPCVQLLDCLRSDKKEILQFAHAVNHQQLNQVISSITNSTHFLRKVDVFNDAKTSKQGYKNLYTFCRDRFLFKYENEETIATLIKSLEGFKILSCMRKGSAGVDAINAYLTEAFWHDCPEGDFQVFPIIINKNDYSLDLFNGDTGILIQKKRNTRKIQEDDYIYFLDKNFTSTRKISAVMVPNFDYGYCISVHKSQGSEYDSILILAPEGSSIFGKEALYTAVTRAKSSVYLDVSDAVIRSFVLKSSRKISGLRDRLSLTKDDSCLEKLP